MLDWLRQPLTHEVAALYRGEVAPAPQELHGLAATGATLDTRPATGDTYWSATVRHPSWGQAELHCPRRPELPLVLAELQTDLEPDELHEVQRCASAVFVRLRGRNRHVLRDRKNAYRLAHALLGAHGVAVLDRHSLHFWSRRALEDELGHEADLGVDGLIALHAVQAEDSEEVAWLHTHGLAEIGRFDFDLLRPSPAILANLSDLTASLTFAILEGTLAEDTPRAQIAEPDGLVSLVPALRFQATARPEDLALRHDPAGTHLDRRAVLCEPSGWLRSLLPQAARRSRFVEEADPERAMFPYSTAASDLIAARARATWGVFVRLCEELADLDLPQIAKLGFDTDPGSPAEREHVWLEVSAASPGGVTGVIANQPFFLSSVREGDRGTHPLERVSDWRILTPLGHIQPSSLAVARRVRSRRDEVAELLRPADR